MARQSLTEEREAEPSVDGDQLIHEKKLVLKGYWKALRDLGIWSNGAQLIGCLKRPIKDIMKQEISSAIVELRINTGQHPAYLQPIFLNEFQEAYMEDKP